MGIGATAKNIKYKEIKWTGSNYASAGCAFEKVSISAGKIINAGFTFARGIKDSPLYLSRAMAFEQEIHDAGNIYVVLYDMRDRRGWLVDGASALLHLTCTQLSTVWSYKSQLFKLEDFHYADLSSDSSAAASALLDPHNRKLPIFEEVETWKEVTTTLGDPAMNSNSVRKEEHKEKKTEWCYQDLVRQTYHILELMHDYQVKALTSPVTNLRLTDRDKLEGFAFMDIVDSTSAIRPRVAILNPSGKGWVDFTRSICAVTLLAKGFGELIKVASNSNRLCRHWQSTPIGQDYLTACISTLSKICNRQGDPDAIPMELASGIFWHKAHMMFEPCTCKGGSEDSMCDRVQVLLPRSLGRKRHPTPFNEVNGAVIFGRSKRYTWSWPKRGNPTEGANSDEEVESEVIAHDSGLGTSLQSNSGVGGDITESQFATYPSSTSPPSHNSSSVMVSGALGQEDERTTSEVHTQMSDTNPIDSLILSSSTRVPGIILRANFPGQKLDIRPRQDTSTAGPDAAENKERSKILKRALEKVRDIASPKLPPSKRVKTDESASNSS